MPFPTDRPRRNRKTDAIRRLTRETDLNPNHLVLPLFVCEGQNERQPIDSLPGVFRHSPDALVEQARKAFALGIPAVELFPALKEHLKNPRGSESLNEQGLLQTTIRKLKEALPELLVISDVALDPYSSDGHDGLLKNGQIDNDETLPLLAQMAVSQAQAGADLVAPSDMMDGRVGFIRQALDEAGFSQVGILAYAAKYASCFYGPFREALGSAPKHGDKKTYQMDPANAREALREVKLDIFEGADLVMVKPALPYLDIIHRVRGITDLPVAAYQVSGEYAMIMAAAQQGWLDADAAIQESLLAIRRAGADIIFTYAALRFAENYHGSAR